MTKTLSVLAICIACSSLTLADEYPIVPIWPHGLPEGAVEFTKEQIEQTKAKTTDERIFYVDEPTLTVLKPEKPNGCCVIVCPGGGYNILAWPKEGIEVGQYLNSLGVTAAVLKYRVPRRQPDARHAEPLQDAQRAIRVARSHADDWGIDPNRIGILGFSAGGHLTLMAGMHYDEASYPQQDEIDKLSAKPNFLCPIYAAYMGVDYADKGPLGDLIKVSKETPPTFLAVTADDSGRGTHAALLFIELQKAGVPAEIHVYTKGGHGYGIRESDRPVSTWHHRLGDWLKDMGFLKM